MPQDIALLKSFSHVYAKNKVKIDELIYNAWPESYCKKCDKQKILREHHCSVCNKCVMLMDHHCVWTNNCIGIANYK